MGVFLLLVLVGAAAALYWSRQQADRVKSGLTVQVNARPEAVTDALSSFASSRGASSLSAGSLRFDLHRDGEYRYAYRSTAGDTGIVNVKPQGKHSSSVHVHSTHLAPGLGEATVTSAQTSGPLRLLDQALQTMKVCPRAHLISRFHQDVAARLQALRSSAAAPSEQSSSTGSAPSRGIGDKRDQASGLAGRTNSVPDAPSRFKIETIRAEWPTTDLDENADLDKWREGMELYAEEDYDSMRRCAELLAPALAHCLYGIGILRGSDLPETIHRVLFTAIFPPPDGQTFAYTSERAARLALTVMREYSWQPASMGGTGRFDAFFDDTGNYLLLASAIAPEGRPWEGNLRDFFAIAPSPLTVPLRSPADATVDLLYEHMQRADAGDLTSQAYFEGIGLWTNGRHEEALSSLTEAANLGSAQAMKDAGDLCLEINNGEELSWFQRAADAGHSGAMHNLGAMALKSGDVQSAEAWFERAAEGGDAGAHAALTQLTLDRGDDAAQQRWARLGAEAGEAFCMFRHGLNLLKHHPDDAPIARLADHYVEAAAHRGNVDAMLLAVDRNHARGKTDLSKSWAQMVRASGDSRAIEVLERYGY
jgi:hypothetical protein